MGPRDRADVLRTIERRIVENRDMLDGARERGETLDVEFLRGCISELEIVQRVVEALPLSNPDKCRHDRMSVSAPQGRCPDCGYTYDLTAAANPEMLPSTINN